PTPSGNRAGSSPARVLVVGHQANQIDRLSKGFQVISAAPVLVEPRRKSGFARCSGRVRHGRDRDLQVLLMKGGGRLSDHCGQRIAVSPVDVLKIKLKAFVAILFAGTKKGR